METNKRSIVKGLSWRALAMLDTVILALIFTGSASIAFSIAGIELITKVLWYYAHERVWIHVPGTHEKYPQVERWLGHDKKMRSVFKAISWRFFGALDTFIIALIVTGRLAVSGSIGGTELVTKIILYYLHDRVWSHISWGKLLVPVADAAGHPSRFKEAVSILRRQYHIAAVIMYAILCILFIVFSAAIIYGLHFIFVHAAPDAVVRIG